jgi:DNA-binding NtrC family response regulator
MAKLSSVPAIGSLESTALLSRRGAGQGTPPVVEQTATDPDAPAAAHKPRVLIIEDVDLLRSLLRDYLEDEGFEVKVAGTCAAAQRIAAYNDIDAVVSDIRLPDGSGIAFCEVLHGAYPHLGIVMMTGFPNEPIPDWIDGTSVPLLHKPLDLLKLCQSIRTVLGADTPARGGH